MNNRIIFVAIVAVLTLTACGKSDDEEQAEKDAAITKKTLSMDIPRIHVAPDKKGDK